MFQTLLFYLPILIATLLFSGFFLAWYLKSKKNLRNGKLKQNKNVQSRHDQSHGKKPSASRGRKNETLGEQHTIADMPETQFISVENSGQTAKIAYIQDGRGRDLVLVHGLGASKYIWRFVFARLVTRGFRVTAVDLPGFGESLVTPAFAFDLDNNAKLLSSFMIAVNIKKPILVGSSMGGLIALWFAKTFPEQTKGLVLMSPATDSARIPKPLLRLLPVIRTLSRRLNAKTMRLFVKLVVERREIIDDFNISFYLKPYLENPMTRHAFADSIRMLRDDRISQLVSGVQIKALIIYGAKDRLVRRLAMLELSKKLDAPFVEHANAGHHIMEDEPSWTIDQLVDFANQ
jgi:pimeloyl-ACP methyl ester carboxylesterase